MEIDRPEILAEVKAAFEQYRKALAADDIITLNRLFRNDPRTIRYGGAENLYGYSEIEAFRSARPAGSTASTQSRTVISTYGHDFAVASTLFHPAHAPDKIGRQMQTWVRFEDGWRIVAAHVSIIRDPAQS